MKIIIEEGDVGGLAPGVYDANESGVFVDTTLECYGEVTNTLKLNVNINMAQEPETLKAFTNHVKPTEPPPVATCDKTFADCAKHGNTLQYCGYVNVNTGRHVPCPHIFGAPDCTGSKFLTPPAMPDAYNPDGVIGVDPQGRPLVFNDKGMVDYAMADVDLAHNLARANEALEECKKRGVTFKKLKDCDECYGTGRFKGMGGPCSEGCPTKGGV